MEKCNEKCLLRVFWCKKLPFWPFWSVAYQQCWFWYGTRHWPQAWVEPKNIKDRINICDVLLKGLKLKLFWNVMKNINPFLRTYDNRKRQRSGLTPCGGTRRESFTISYFQLVKQIILNSPSSIISLISWRLLDNLSKIEGGLGGFHVLWVFTCCYRCKTLLTQNSHNYFK